MKIRLLISLLILSNALNAQFESPETILNKYRKATTIESLTSQLSYKNISKKGRVQERTLKQYVSKNNNGENCYSFLLQFMAPSDVRNTAALTIQNAEEADDQWLYLPVIKRAKRISARKKSDRFMGTEMSYEDLSNYLSEPESEYQYTSLPKEYLGSRKCHVLSASSLPGSPTQYSKRIMWIDQENHILVKSEFYDKKGKLLKVYTASDIRSVGNDFYRAHKIELVNVQTKNRTEVSYSDIVINSSIDNNIFSKSYVESL